MKTDVELLQTQFIILRRRIVHHRSNCIHWINEKSCYNCHKGKLTRIEKIINRMVIE